ncbi:hypothetical protein F3J38_04380 [Pantoea sp. Acro-805]|uniref:Uncharacterized protein n=1 Tax=Candidatus Pantoea formicae TaxID=2608355 RepID=A0ABX0QVB4_9GAMM|nr:hypothetical protein [Pantoea formicae]MDF7649428.1 hypothetical protein [Erwiniaceae bacterium L1_54_3]NIE99315.1 hypothetical protein [Pantoea formicae]
MSIQHDDKSQVMIGEAALNLALAEREISVQSLISQLDHMAAASGSQARRSEISAASLWLKSFDDPWHAARHVPYLQTLAGFNDE